MWALGGALWAVVVGLAVAIYHLQPAPAPYRVISDHVSFTAPDVWTIETLGEYQTTCATVVIRRTFFGDGESWEVAPISGSVMDMTSAGEIVNTAELDDIRYVLESPKAGYLRKVTLHYAVDRRVREGTYVVQGEAYNCENGFAGLLEPRNIQFSWPKAAGQ